MSNYESEVADYLFRRVFPPDPPDGYTPSFTELAHQVAYKVERQKEMSRMLRMSMMVISLMVGFLLGAPYGCAKAEQDCRENSSQIH